MRGSINQARALPRLQRRQRSCTFSAVLEPPQERGITWSKWRSLREPQLRHRPPSRCQTKRRVSTLTGAVSSLGPGFEPRLRSDAAGLRRIGRLRRRKARS